MVIFLGAYEASISQSSKQRDFLETSFTYAIYDLIEHYEDTGRESQISEELKEIAQEIHELGTRTKTRKFLEYLLETNNQDFINNIKQYLSLFYNPKRNRNFDFTPFGNSSKAQGRVFQRS